MIKNVLTELGGIGSYGIISVCLFFAVFLGAVALALRHEKTFLDRMSALPLDDDEPGTGTKGDPPNE